MDSRRRSRVVAALGAVLAMVLVTGCADPGGPADSEMVVSWSQAWDGWVSDVVPVPTTLVTSETDREAWLTRLPDAVGKGDVELLRDADLDEVFLVIGGYHSCREVSRVEVDPGTGEVAFVVFVHEDDEGTMCAWSPYRIDVWAVPIEATGGHEPVLADVA